MTTAVILNPWAGRGRGARIRQQLQQALHAADIEHRLVETEPQGGGATAVQRALDSGATRLAAVGGDGTFGQVVSGLLGEGDVAAHSLTLVPIGTGNDFVKSLPGIGVADFAGAAQRLRAGRPQPIDVGRIEVETAAGCSRHVFINGLGMGLDAAVAVESHKIRGLSGPLIYLLAVFRALARYQPAETLVEYDGGRLHRRLFFAGVANGRCQGGGFRLTPQAEIDDGRLDLCAVDQKSIAWAISRIPSIQRGTHTGLREVTMARSPYYRVSSAQPFPVAVDGEVISEAAQRVTVTTLPHAVTLLV
jgi:diacylglycerol kinase (ATP)